jgi:hypothetical protein
LSDIFSSHTHWQHFSARELINESNTALSQALENQKNKEGIYVFWWAGCIEELLKLNRKILLQGKKEGDSFKWLPIEWQVEWFAPVNFDNVTHYSLYVGKSTTLRSRIRNHFHFSLSHQSWIQALGKPKNKDNRSKLVALKGMRQHHNSGHQVSYNPTTSCQFRAGMSLLCRDNNSNEEFWDIIKKNVVLSVYESNNKDESLAVAERFYLEDYLIGALRPWFNLDSER